MVKTIIFGNGLGMALNPAYFKLQSGLNAAWEYFSQNEREVIQLNLQEMPSSESDLENHHRVMTACRTLEQYEIFLSENGKSFPTLYQQFIFKTAKHFFEDSQENLPDNFVDRLCAFIQQGDRENDRCHIATLNYDNLLYTALVNKKILCGYHTQGLVDGFHNDSTGFKPENLIRTSCNFGWYLHLHGSPIFKTEPCGIIKKERSFSDHSDDIFRNHIVLAKTNFKPSIIAQSELLSSYFDFFIRALNESDEVYIIGYSGLDEHVNFEIKDWIKQKNKQERNFKVYIVEWQQNPNECDDVREKFWLDRIGIKKQDNVCLKRMPNILDYDFSSFEI